MCRQAGCLGELAQVLARQKADKEDEALSILHEDLNTQLRAIEAKSKSTGGGCITSLMLRERLTAQYQSTVDGYEQLVIDSQHELAETEAQVN